MVFQDDLDTTVEQIIDQAIEFYMKIHHWTRHGGGNYINPGAPDFEITPPGKPKRTSGGQVYYQGKPDSWGFDHGEGHDAGTRVYAHFENTIRDLFVSWRSVPSPAAFLPYIDSARVAVTTISLNVDTEKVTEIGNGLLCDGLTTLKDMITPMGGTAINNFKTDFSTPLPRVIHAQYAVCLHVAATLAYEHATWLKARNDILAIADEMRRAMVAPDSGIGLDLSTLTAILEIAATLAPDSTMQKVLNGAKAVFTELEGLISPPGEQDTKTPVEFAAGTPDGVIEKTKKALNLLARDITTCENDIAHRSRTVMETVTSGGDPLRRFDLPKPGLLGETQVDGFVVNLDNLRFLATDTLPTMIATYLAQASDGIAACADSKSAWYRPEELDVYGTHGPYDTWAALAAMAEALTGDLAWEITESANHLAIVADQTARTDAEVEASMQQHADQLDGGSGYNPIGDAGTWLDEHPRRRRPPEK